MCPQDIQRPLPPTSFPIIVMENSKGIVPSARKSSFLHPLFRNIYSSPIPFPLPVPSVETFSTGGIDNITLPSDPSQSPEKIKSIPLTLHEKKKRKATEIIRARQSIHSDSSSSCSSSSSCCSLSEGKTAPVTNSKHTELLPPTTPTPVGAARFSGPFTKLHHSESGSGQRAVRLSEGSVETPVLNFSTLWRGQSPSYTFYCKEGWILNDSKKAPSYSSYNVTIRDSLYIASSVFRRCTCKLKIKDNSTDGLTVSTDMFKPTNTNSSEMHECTITIPQRITTIKSNSASRTGYLEVYNQQGECIAISGYFWIRTRSRAQIDRDTKRKIACTHSNQSPKRVRSDETDDYDIYYSSSSNSSSRSTTGDDTMRKYTKIERDTLAPRLTTSEIDTVMGQSQKKTELSTLRTTNLPDLPCDSFVQSLYSEVVNLRQMVLNHENEISRLKQLVNKQ